ncbi:MAG: Phosphoribosylglycinamide formyltransferase [Crocinitomicaceae bacterium]|jgi:phosphoribosylglycinamide formyltransferase-1|nr:Phosphoribosylglycinamide formyltransferase [Crocinitomicaceae bacterium]
MVRQKIAVFASGTGSNALNIISYFENHPQIEVAFVLSNKADAPVVDAARKLGIETVIVPNERIETPGVLIDICKERKVNGIILAGFLRKIPMDFVEHYENRILNIHPSLLPKYGGAGMYGKLVHEAVRAAGEVETGITIHYVNSEYDKGEIIAQFSCPLEAGEPLESILEKIHRLEMEHFPRVIEELFTRS